MIIERRKFLIGLGAVMVAPAIVRIESLMPVKVFKPIGPLMVRVDASINGAVFRTHHAPVFCTIKEAIDFVYKMNAPESIISLATGVYAEAVVVKMPEGEHHLEVSNGEVAVIRNLDITSSNKRKGLFQASFNGVVDIGDSNVRFESQPQHSLSISHAISHAGGQILKGQK